MMGVLKKAVNAQENPGSYRLSGLTLYHASYYQKMNPDGGHSTTENDKEAGWEMSSTELSC